jgi:hypothetical protein
MPQILASIFLLKPFLISFLGYISRDVDYQESFLGGLQEETLNPLGAFLSDRSAKSISKSPRRTRSSC